MTDANWIFDRAVELMDEMQPGDRSDFRDRTLGILNLLRHELYPFSDTFEPGRLCPEIQSFDQPLDLDDGLAQGALPYGLAAHLLLGENDVSASVFLQRYTELLYGLGCRKMAQWEEIM